VPVLCSYLLPERPHQEPWLMRWITRGYRPLLDWSLVHARWVGVIAAGLLAIGAVAYLAIGKTFMPVMNEGDLLIQLVKKAAIRLDASRQQELALERAILSSLPEVEHVISRVGSDVRGLDPLGLNE